MTTYTALTTMQGQDTANALAEAVEALTPEPTGVGVFEVEDGSGLWEVGVYFTEAPDEAGLAVLATLFEVKPFVVSEVPDQDWVAKVRRELSPVDAGRFFVFGSHDADKVPEGKIPLLIEAAMAFGTGHHGTTLGCLRAFDQLLDDGVRPQNVVDIGCGTAVLAMAAAQATGRSVMAGDIDPHGGFSLTLQCSHLLCEFFRSDASGFFQSHSTTRHLVNVSMCGIGRCGGNRLGIVAAHQAHAHGRLQALHAGAVELGSRRFG